MKYYEKNQYKIEIKDILKYEDMFKILKDKVVVITGTRGLIGSMLVDTIMFANRSYHLNCKIYGVVRNLESARQRFAKYEGMDCFKLVLSDINKDSIPIVENIDYLIHGASNTHPLYYSMRPIETIQTNTIGTNNVLEFASSHGCNRFIFMSSVEIYGENKGDVDKFDENYLGYINSNTLRAGYPEGKRLGESLCQAYIKEKNLDCVILRISRAYGPGLLKEDTKALSQFISKAKHKENIILKSKGDQFYSYVYVTDVVSAILFLLAKGVKGEAYNVSGTSSDITLADLANYIAKLAGTNVMFDLPDIKEAEGYSKATKALLDTTKISDLGWNSRYSIKEGIQRTLALQGEDWE